MKLNKLYILTLLAATPSLAFAQSTGTTNFDSIQGALISIGNLINLAIPVLIAVAVLVFVFGIVKFIVNANDAEKRKDGAKFIISGLIGIFVILTLFGLVNILQETFGLESNQNTVTGNEVPTIPLDRR